MLQGTTIAKEIQNGFVVDGIQQIDGLKIFNRTYELAFDSEGLSGMQEDGFSVNSWYVMRHLNIYALRCLHLPIS